MYSTLPYSLVLCEAHEALFARSNYQVEQQDNIIVRLVGRVTCLPSLYLDIWLWIFIIGNQPALDGDEPAVAE